MKTIKTTVMAVAVLAAMVGRASESAEFRLDTMDGPRTARAVETIAYSTAWNNSDLKEYFKGFCDGAGMVAVIYCCHSSSMFLQDNDSMNLGRVGWILSSQADEQTWSYSVTSIICNFCGARVVVPSLPEAVRPLAEVETNVVFSTGAATDNKWTLTIEHDAAAWLRIR